MEVAVSRHRCPSPLTVAVAVAVAVEPTVAVAVAVAVEPVGFDGFFRAYERYGGALCAWGRMGALCVGASCVRYGGSVERWENGGGNGGRFRGVNDGDKKGCQPKTG